MDSSLRQHIRGVYEKQRHRNNKSTDIKCITCIGLVTEDGMYLDAIHYCRETKGYVPFYSKEGTSKNQCPTCGLADITSVTTFRILAENYALSSTKIIPWEIDVDSQCFHLIGIESPISMHVYDCKKCRKNIITSTFRYARNGEPVIEICAICSAALTKQLSEDAFSKDKTTSVACLPVLPQFNISTPEFSGNEILVKISQTETVIVHDFVMAMFGCKIITTALSPTWKKGDWVDLSSLELPEKAVKQVLSDPYILMKRWIPKLDQVGCLFGVESGLDAYHAADAMASDLAPYYLNGAMKTCSEKGDREELKSMICMASDHPLMLEKLVDHIEKKRKA